jgi:putative membrane protein
MEAAPLDLGYERTRLAADRTLMAWIRTSVSLISFGFSIYKFFQYLQETNVASTALHHYAPRNFGVALVIVGMFLLAVAMLDYYLFLKKLNRFAGQKFQVSLTPAAAVILFIIGIMVLINLMFRIGPI